MSYLISYITIRKTVYQKVFFSVFCNLRVFWLNERKMNNGKKFLSRWKNISFHNYSDMYVIVYRRFLFFSGSFWSQLLSKYDNHLPWMLLKQVDSARRLKPRRRFSSARDSRTDFTRDRKHLDDPFQITAPIDWSIDWMIIDPFQFTAPPARPNVILYDSNIVISQHACWRNCITRSSICVRQIYLVAAQW